jgi:hypothetical protein
MLRERGGGAEVTRTDLIIFAGLCLVVYLQRLEREQHKLLRVRVFSAKYVS